MLNSAKVLKNYCLNSLDGKIGRVKDFYFDDQYWQIQYLVVNTGTWLKSRKVLISTHSIVSVNQEEEMIIINLSKEQIENSPSLDTEKPVSVQYQEKLNAHYCYPMYWGNLQSVGIGISAGGGFTPSAVFDSQNDETKEPDEKEEVWDPNLRSINYVSGYSIHSEDKAIGHIDDFIIDDETWDIRYLVDNTHSWLPGKKFLLSSEWIHKVSWHESLVLTLLSPDKIEQSPEYDEEMTINRDYEVKLFEYYDKKGYW